MLVEFRKMMEDSHKVFLAQMAEREKRGLWKTDKNDLLEISEMTEEPVSEKVEQL